MAAIEASAPPQAHLVVFDVNVYLDVARLLGEPFSWEGFSALATRAAQWPTPTDPMFDSVRAIATTLSGRFAGMEPLEVWTSDHIDDTVEFKAAQAPLAGLGWSAAAAGDLVVDLIGEVCVRSHGGSVPVEISYGAPPLDHEDGLVYRTANEAGDPSVYYERYCVTRDREFHEAMLPGPIEVLTPREFVSYVRLARQAMATGNMPRPR